MKLLTHISEIPKSSNCGLTIGNFDGIHIGHKKFIEECKENCQKKGLSFVVLTFVPHPLVTLQNRENFLINSYQQRREFFKDLGVDYLIEMKFSRDFSTLSPKDFLDDHIFKNGNINYLYLGHDFSFGSNKSGDHKFVDEYCEKNSVEDYIQQEYESQGDKVSSTEVRDC